MTCFRYSNNDVFVWISKASVNMVTARSAIKNSHIEHALILIFQNGKTNRKEWHLNCHFGKSSYYCQTNKSLTEIATPSAGRFGRGRRCFVEVQEEGTPRARSRYATSFLRLPSFLSSFCPLFLPSSSFFHLSSFIFCASFFPSFLLSMLPSSLPGEFGVA